MRTLALLLALVLAPQAALARVAAFPETALRGDREISALRVGANASQLAETRQETACFYDSTASAMTDDPINHRDPTGEMVPDCSVDWGSPLSKLKWVFGIVPKECETGAVASTIELGPGLLAKGASAVSRGAKIVEAIEETKVASKSAPAWRRLLGPVLKSEGEVARIEAQAAKVESAAAHDVRLELEAAERVTEVAPKQAAELGRKLEYFGRGLCSLSWRELVFTSPQRPANCSRGT